MLAEAFKVQRGAVALVLREAVFGEFAIEVEHESIAGDFGDHARGGDGKAKCISTDQRGLFDGELPDRKAVDQDMIGFGGELRGGGSHGLVRGAKDVDLIDFAVVDDGDGPMHIRPSNQFVVEALALKMGQLLRIAQDIVVIVARQYDSSGDHRAGEGTTAGLINSRNKRKASSTKSVLVLEAAIHRRLVRRKRV